MKTEGDEIETMTNESSEYCRQKVSDYLQKKNYFIENFRTTLLYFQPQPKNEFGSVFSDHMLKMEYDECINEWKPAQIKKLENISLHPATKVFHYCQTVRKLLIVKFNLPLGTYFTLWT